MVCEWCKNEYEQKRFNQRFCCRECKEKQKQKRKCSKKEKNIFIECSCCHKIFEKTRSDKKYCSYKCKDKVSRKKNGWKCHKRRNWRKNNIPKSFTIQDYNLMIEQQNNMCKICGRHRNELKSDLAVDHNHLTGKIRGLLCHRCNITLGVFKDDPLLFIKAAEYLQS